jgi:hypothetical protein
MDIGIQMEGSIGKLADKVAVVTGCPKESERRLPDAPKPIRCSDPGETFDHRHCHVTRVQRVPECVGCSISCTASRCLCRASICCRSCSMSSGVAMYRNSEVASKVHCVDDPKLSNGWSGVSNGVGGSSRRHVTAR